MDHNQETQAEPVVHCRRCIEPMNPWPGQMYVCMNAGCELAGEPQDPPEAGGSTQGDGYYSSAAMANAQREIL